MCTHACSNSKGGFYHSSCTYGLPIDFFTASAFQHGKMYTSNGMAERCHTCTAALYEMSHLHSYRCFVSLRQELHQCFTVIPVPNLWPILKQLVGIWLVLWVVVPLNTFTLHRHTTTLIVAHHPVLRCSLQDIRAFLQQDIGRGPKRQVRQVSGDMVK